MARHGTDRERGQRAVGHGRPRQGPPFDVVRGHRLAGVEVVPGDEDVAARSPPVARGLGLADDGGRDEDGDEGQRAERQPADGGAGESASGAHGQEGGVGDHRALPRSC